MNNTCLHRQQLFQEVKLVLKWVRNGKKAQLKNPTKNKQTFSLLNPSLFPSGKWHTFLGLRGLKSKGRFTVTLQVSQLIPLPNKSALYILMYGRNPHVRRRLEVNLCLNNKNKKLLHMSVSWVKWNQLYLWPSCTQNTVTKKKQFLCGSEKWVGHYTAVTKGAAHSVWPTGYCQ